MEVTWEEEKREDEKRWEKSTREIRGKEEKEQ